MDLKQILSKPKFIPGASGVVPTLDNCYGYYNAQDSKGKLVGPLVGYAGTYDIERDGQTVKEAYVGYEFYNFAMAEQWTHVMDSWADHIMDTHFRPLSLQMTAFLGAPMGGLAFAQALTRSYNSHLPFSDARYIYAEKETLELKTPTSREKSRVTMNRHVFLPGDIVAGAEDVTNNFSTTGNLVNLADQDEASIDRIVAILNRSGLSEYQAADGRRLKVVSVCHLPTEQFRQDDPRIAAQIAEFGLIPKPKDVWLREVIPYILRAKAYQIG